MLVLVCLYFFDSSVLASSSTPTLSHIKALESDLLLFRVHRDTKMFSSCLYFLKKQANNSTPVDAFFFSASVRFVSFLLLLRIFQLSEIIFHPVFSSWFVDDLSSKNQPLGYLERQIELPNVSSYK